MPTDHASTDPNPQPAASPARTLRLATECALLFAAAPLVMAFALPAGAMWTALAAITVVGLVLLALTPGFRWRSLLRRPIVGDWRLAIGFVIATAALCLALVFWFVPWRLFALPRHATDLWLTILLFYPFLSAIPQEIVYRVLFFERYGRLFGPLPVAVVANAAAFSLAHLFFGNWLAVCLTFLAGIVFAIAYSLRGSFLFAALLHSVGGQILFTSGLGIFFYHGAAGRF